VNLFSAQVLLCKNYVDAARQLVNGSRGIVTDFRGAAGSQGEPLPVVRFLDGGEQLIKKQAFTVESDGKVLASRTQLPLILAWAMTVHKTQGMSLDSMVLHLDGAFEYGQVYVGLSRARSLTGLEVRGFRPDLVKAHPKALQFYSTVTHLHTQSAPFSQRMRTPLPASLRACVVSRGLAKATNRLGRCERQ
jgi:ATP-dependent DNA helicase PIF1